MIFMFDYVGEHSTFVSTINPSSDTTEFRLHELVGKRQLNFLSKIFSIFNWYIEIEQV